METDVTELTQPDGEADRYRQRADRAMAFWTIGDKGRAVLEMEAALGEMPERADGWHTLGEYLDALSADSQAEADPKQAQMLRARALAALRKAVELSPEMAKSHNALGNLYWADDFRKALAEYEIAAGLDPQYKSARDIAAQIVSECIYRLERLHVVQLDSLRETPSAGALGADFYIEQPPIASAVLHTAVSINGQQWIHGWLFTEEQPDVSKDRPVAELAVSSSGDTSVVKGCPANYDSVLRAALSGSGSPSSDAADAVKGEQAAPAEPSLQAVVAPPEGPTRLQEPRDSAPVPLPIAPPQGPAQPARRVDRWLTALVGGVAVIGAVFFAMSELWKAPSSQSAPPLVGTGVASSAVSRAISTAGPPPSEAPATPESNASSAAVPSVPALDSARPRNASVSSPSTAVRAATPLRSGKVVYASSCVSCHATGVSGSPRLDDFDAWGPKFNRSRVSLYASVLEGKGTMPPRGGDRSLRDLEVKRAVDYMLASASTMARAAVVVPPPPASNEPPPPEPPLHAPTTAPKAPIEVQPGWLSSLRSDLERCRAGSFLDRIACTERARWQHCAPNRWETVPECAVGKAGAAPEPS